MKKVTVAVASVLAMVACGVPQFSASAASSPVIVVFLENHWDQAFNTTNAPYIVGLKARGTYFSNYWSLQENSFPNYMAFASGNRQTETDASAAAGAFVGPSIWGQLTQAGIDWRVAQEGMATTCSTAKTRVFTGSQGQDQYALKHNPATPFQDVYPSNCQRVIDLSALDVSNLPPLTFVTPTICNDMHGVQYATTYGYPANCEVKTQPLITRSDQWLAARVPSWLAAGATVFITFDEAVGSRMFTVMVGPDTPAGVVNSATFNHYSALAGLEDRFGLARLGLAVGAPAVPFGSFSFRTRSVNLSKVGKGRITSDPAGINCGSDCTGDFAEGSHVTLTAKARAEWEFKRWRYRCKGQGEVCTIEVTSNFRAMAVFVRPPIVGGDRNRSYNRHWRPTHRDPMQ
jgi:hypothetical protein